MVLARTRYRISFPGAASVPAPPGSLWGALSVTTPATAQQCNAACAACLRTVALLFSAPSSARPVAGLGLSVLTNRALRRLSPVGTGTLGQARKHGFPGETADPAPGRRPALGPSLDSDSQGPAQGRAARGQGHFASPGCPEAQRCKEKTREDDSGGLAMPDAAATAGQGTRDASSVAGTFCRFLSF